MRESVLSTLTAFGRMPPVPSELPHMLVNGTHIHLLYRRWDVQLIYDWQG